jgi:hypothetical protein
MRRFPLIPKWKTTFDVHVLDPIITEAILKEMPVSLDCSRVWGGIVRPIAEKTVGSS